MSQILTESLKIEIDGEEIDDAYDELATVAVELDEELPGMVRMRLPMLQQADGAWTFLDDERFSAWKPIVVSAGLDGELEELLAGYITHVRPRFEPDMTACVLDVWGLDASVVMDREDQLKDWPNKKDSDIAAELFTEYGLTPETDDTEVIHDEAVSTIIQRETDWQFLARLALRNGFECFVDRGIGHFHRPRLNEPPQPLLAVQFGEETNVSRFAFEVDALKPANVAMRAGRPAGQGGRRSAVADGGDLPALGATEAIGAARRGHLRRDDDRPRDGHDGRRRARRDLPRAVRAPGVVRDGPGRDRRQPVRRRAAAPRDGDDQGRRRAVPRRVLRQPRHPHVLAATGTRRRSRSSATRSSRRAGTEDFG